RIPRGAATGHPHSRNWRLDLGSSGRETGRGVFPFTRAPLFRLCFHRLGGGALGLFQYVLKGRQLGRRQARSGAAVGQGGRGDGTSIGRGETLKIVRDLHARTRGRLFDVFFGRRK